jgi:multidrug transporter EmrE-like cation transporter
LHRNCPNLGYAQNEGVMGASMAASMKPKSITSFNRLNFGATLVGIANILIHYATLRNLALSKGASPAGPFLGIVLLALSFLIFWFFIYRRGSNIAKWLFVALTVFSAALIPLNLSETIAVGKTYAVIDGIAFAFHLAAVAMLFRGDTRAWLGRSNSHQADA